MTTDASEKAIPDGIIAQVVGTGYKKEGRILSRQLEKLMEEEMKKRG